MCSADKETITVLSSYLPGFSHVCGVGEIGVEKTAYYNGASIGSITCPFNYELFCANQNCKNFCSLNGVCIRDICHCNPGYAGQDCSQTCEKYSNDGVCVTECPTGKYANPDNDCKLNCQHGYYADSTNKVCLLCDFECSRCSGPSNTECTACQFLTYLNGNTCVRTCPIGMFPDESTKSCRNCPFGCVNCLTETICGTCQTTYMKQGDQCRDPACDSSCIICWINSITQCLSCATGKYWNESTMSCVSVCPNGKFANALNNSCTTCPAGCTSCTSAFVCTECATTSGYRKQWSLCVPCIAPCFNCDSSDSQKCTSCLNGKKLLGFNCIDQCPIKYYSTSNDVCSACIQGCLTCSNSNSCETCDSANGYVLYIYQNNNICVRSLECFSPCKACKYNYTPDICSTCITGYNLQGTTCQTTCNTGYLASSQVCYRICDSSKSCYRCMDSDPTKCISCQYPNYLFDNACYSSCPSGYYGITSNQTCGKCSTGCLSCQDTGFCKTCDTANGYRRYSYQSKMICVNKDSCLSPCATCTGSGGGVDYLQESCSSCIPGLTLQNNKCVCIKGDACDTCDASKGQVPYVYQSVVKCILSNACLSPCATCNVAFQPENCSTCLTNYLMQGTVCQSMCNEEFYYISPKCRRFCQTSKNCEYCLDSDPSKCTSCPSGKVLYDSSCIGACPERYYASDQVCMSCIDGCKVCLNSVSCQTCAAGYVLQGSICQTSCNSGYETLDSLVCTRICEPLYNCKKCEDSNLTLCITCKSGYFYYGKECLLSCGGSKYPDSNSVCQECVVGCIKCLNGNSCTECVDFLGYSLYTNNLGKAICIKSTDCFSPCATCTAPNKPESCATCPSGKYLQGNLCQSKCDESFSPVGSVCVSTCDPTKNCLRCLTTDKTKCTACQTNMYLIDQVCYSACPNGYYNYQGLYCVHCATGCVSCLDANTCTACDTNTGYQLYKFNSSMICIKSNDCFEPCKTCTGRPFSPEECASCTSNYKLQAGSCVIGCSSEFFESYPGICSRICDIKFSCGQCLDTDPTSCISCFPGRYLYDKKCITQCPPGFIDQSNECVQCMKGCSACTDALNCSTCISSQGYQLYTYKKKKICIQDTDCFEPCGACPSKFQPEVCSSCIQSYIFIENNKCIASCTAGYKLVQNTCKRICDASVSSSCLYCLDNNNKICEHCQAGLWIYKNTCYENCPLGSYQKTEGICSMCSNECKECTSFETCLTCNDQMVKYRYYQSDICISKLDCFEPCATCDSYKPEACNSCISKFVLMGKQCRFECDSGFKAGSDGVCKEICDSTKNCLACLESDSTKCTECHTGMVLVESSCLSACPKGYYFNTSSGCQKCLESCETCENGSACLTCNSNGYYAASTNGSKVVCKKIGQCDSPCATCSNQYNSNDCSTCEKGSSLQENLCLEECNIGYVAVNNVCVRSCKKISGCLICSVTELGDELCVVCELPLYNFDNACISECPSRHFGTGKLFTGAELKRSSGYTANICGKCDSDQCLKCSSQFICEQCDSDNGYEKYPFYGMDSCVQKDQCNKPCASCGENFQPEKCSSCLDGYLLQGHQCLEECNFGWFQDGKICVLTCQDSWYEMDNKCVQTCDSSRLIQENKCLTECGNGFYQVGSVCQECDSNCGECLESPTNCTACNIPKSLMETKCVESCPTNFISNKSVCVTKPKLNANNTKTSASRLSAILMLILKLLLFMYLFA